MSLTSQVSCRHGIEDHLLPGVVRVQRRDHPLERVVEQHRAHADADVELERACRVKNGSYCRTGLPLLLKTVQPLPTQRGDGRPPRRAARARPGSSSGSRGRSRRSRRSRAGSCRPPAGSEVGCRGSRGPACRPRRAAGLCRVVRALIGEQVVDEPGGGLPQQGAAGRPAGRRGAPAITAVGQVGVEAVERDRRSVRPRACPSRPCRPPCPARRTATSDRLRLGSVTSAAAGRGSRCPGGRAAARVALAGRDSVAERVPRFEHQQVVGVVGDEVSVLTGHWKGSRNDAAGRSAARA